MTTWTEKEIMMNDYIKMRMRASARLAIDFSRNDEKIQHAGLRGRFRELLADNVLMPWLPPSVSCGTGVIIDAYNKVRKSTQEDIVIYDSTIMPSILISNFAQEGVFPINGVLARVEVKSILDAANLRDAISAAAEVEKMTISALIPGTCEFPPTFVFAFGTNLTGEPRDELYRLTRETSNLGIGPVPVTGLCVVGRGCWVRRDTEWWEFTRTDECDDIVNFASAVSDTCFKLRQERHGIDHTQTKILGISALAGSTSTRISLDEK